MRKRRSEESGERKNGERRTKRRRGGWRERKDLRGRRKDRIEKTRMEGWRGERKRERD